MYQYSQEPMYVCAYACLYIYVNMCVYIVLAGAYYGMGRALHAEGIGAEAIRNMERAVSLRYANLNGLLLSYK